MKHLFKPETNEHGAQVMFVGTVSELKSELPQPLREKFFTHDNLPSDMTEEEIYGKRESFDNE